MLKIIQPKYLVPVIPRCTVLQDQAVVVDSVSGRILDILDRGDAPLEYPEAPVLRLDKHVLIPGLINMHTHSPMTLLRGYADDVELSSWLKDHIWPAEKQWANRQFVYDGTHLALVEMIRSGTTCFNENYFFPDMIAQAVDEAGIRAVIGIPVIDFETGWAGSAGDYIDKGLALAAQHRDHSLISFSFAPHSTYSVAPDYMREIARLSQRDDLPVHLHLLEIDWEIQHSLETNGCKPLEYVDRCGLLNSRLIAVHMVHLDDDDLDLLEGSGVNVVHCPHSNLKLASGICRTAELISRQINTTIGTDGPAANNSLSMFDELRTASLLAKGGSGNPQAADAMKSLEMVTIDAARALGMDSVLGSVEAGKQADLVALNLDFAGTQPVHDLISQLVYTAPGHQVSHVWVAGQLLLDDGALTRQDEESVLDSARQWARRMKGAQ